MGKCYSCCESPGGEPGHSTCQSAQSGHSGDQRGSGVFNATQTKDSRAVYFAGDYQQHPSSGIRQPISTLERKMFTQYPKLPPIKKQSNGDSKRLSLISRDYSESKIQSLFEHYKEPGEDVILADGIEALCFDLDVKPDEFIVLVLAWKFQAETMCRFTREEFIIGCKTLKVDSIKGIQSKFPELYAEVQNKQSFKDLYRWTYKFGLDAESGQRTLPTDMAIGLWKLIFSQKRPSILDHWMEFLEKHHTIRGIPKDTWDMFLNFVEQVSDDLSVYDDTEAWPSLFDDFVEYENDRRNQNVMTD